MSLLNNLYINIYGIINRKKILQEAITELYKHDGQEAQNLLNVLNGVFKKKLSYDESGALNQIENLRRKMNLSFRKINVHSSSGTNQMSLSRISLSSKTRHWAIILYSIVREFRPVVCLELGTNVGISASYQATALKNTTKGTLWTLEGDEERADIAEKNFRTLKLENVKVIRGKFNETLPKVLAANPRIDYAFIDGHHDEQATLDYFSKIIPHLSENAVVVFDDISWSDGMKRSWAQIKKFKRVTLFVDLFVMGIVVISK